MIIKRIWTVEKLINTSYGKSKTKVTTRQGWFLFGVIPLYIRDYSYHYIS